MILTVLLALAAAVMVWKIEEPEDAAEWIQTILLGALGFAAVFFIGIVLAALLGMAVPEDDSVYEQKQLETLCALKNGSSVTGRFFIAMGYIDEEPCYYYIADAGKGYKLQKIKAKIAYVVEEDGEPCITWYTAAGFRHPLLWLIAIPSDSYAIIRVPEGTIAQEYEVRLE